MHPSTHSFAENLLSILATKQLVDNLNLCFLSIKAITINLPSIPVVNTRTTLQQEYHYTKWPCMHRRTNAISPAVGLSTTCNGRMKCYAGVVHKTMINNSCATYNRLWEKKLQKEDHNPSRIGSLEFSLLTLGGITIPFEGVHKVICRTLSNHPIWYIGWVQRQL